MSVTEARKALEFATFGEKDKIVAAHQKLWEALCAEAEKGKKSDNR